MDISAIENTLNIEFRNGSLLKEAITHRSYLNENPAWNAPHNERLEFLGDAVLELIVTEHLFKLFPEHSEGELTNIRAALVNYQMLAKVAKEMRLDEIVLLSKGEAKDSSRAKDVIVADAFEAVLGALYLDQGYEAVKNITEKNLLPKIPEIIENKTYKDPKSLLQEIIQEKIRTTPTYQVLSEEGPDHNKIFEVGVFFGSHQAGSGRGFSKQEAEIEAAKSALEKINQHES